MRKRQSDLPALTDAEKAVILLAIQALDDGAPNDDPQVIAALEVVRSLPPGWRGGIPAYRARGGVWLLDDAAKIRAGLAHLKVLNEWWKVAGQ